MKLAISSTGETLDSEVDLRFGRCGYFILYDDESKEYETLRNSAQVAGGGAGVQAAEKIANSGVKVVLTSNVGPKAFQVLNSAGVMVATGVSGTVKEVVEKYIAGEISVSQEPSVDAHHGLK